MALNSQVSWSKLGLHKSARGTRCPWTNRRTIGAGRLGGNSGFHPASSLTDEAKSSVAPVGTVDAPWADHSRGDWPPTGAWVSDVVPPSAETPNGGRVRADPPTKRAG
jgi:hypothetical protein